MPTHFTHISDIATQHKLRNKMIENKNKVCQRWHTRHYKIQEQNEKEYVVGQSLVHVADQLVATLVLMAVCFHNVLAHLFF